MGTHLGQTGLLRADGGWVRPAWLPKRLPALQLRPATEGTGRSQRTPARCLWRADLAAQAEGCCRRQDRAAGLVERRKRCARGYGGDRSAGAGQARTWERISREPRVLSGVRIEGAVSGRPFDLRARATVSRHSRRRGVAAPLRGSRRVEP